MKLALLPTSRRRQSGITLTECLMYIIIFSILFGVATGAFYLSWDHTRAVVAATDKIEAATRAGERWRADIRQATGKITTTSDANGQTIRIPETDREVLYQFSHGELRRQVAASQFPELVLPAVKISNMKSDPHGTVTAWRWDVELLPVHKQTSLPLRFTFEAAAPGQ